MNPSQPRILAIVNQKGGVGKTTTAVNLATALAAVGKKTLILDFDPQGNASTGLGIHADKRNITSYDLVMGEASLESTICKTAIPNLFVSPSTMDLSGAEIELVSMMKREYKLDQALKKSSADLDYILIDCPPSLGLLTLNALVAAHAVLIPLQCEFYALEGLSHLIRTIQLVQVNLNEPLEIQGIVLTMYDKRNKLTEQIEQEVREYFKEQVYRTTVPRNVRISEAPSHGKPALIYDLQCAGSRAYINLASELLKRENRRHQLLAA